MTELLSDLLLSARARSCIQNLEPQPRTCAELQAFSDAQLMREPNVGRVTLSELRRLCGRSPQEEIEAAMKRALAEAGVIGVKSYSRHELRVLEELRKAGYDVIKLAND